MWDVRKIKHRRIPWLTLLVGTYEERRFWVGREFGNAAVHIGRLICILSGSGNVAGCVHQTHERGFWTYTLPFNGDRDSKKVAGSLNDVVPDKNKNGQRETQTKLFHVGNKWREHPSETASIDMHSMRPAYSRLNASNLPPDLQTDSMAVWLHMIRNFSVNRRGTDPVRIVFVNVFELPTVLREAGGRWKTVNLSMLGSQEVRAGWEGAGLSRAYPGVVVARLRDSSIPASGSVSIFWWLGRRIAG
ncbi:hypothetical protein DFH06DRAFT_1297636 [Mycena polygramma]|nr:hypothetical protein DFH06DRAFT_1297636 [Mycena polygramma]